MIALNIMKISKTKSAVVAGVVLVLVAGTTMVTERMAPNVPFQQDSIARADQAKKLALACVLFAKAHGNKLPQDFGFGQLKPFDPMDGLSESDWEIVSSGNLHSFANPGQTILLREKDARKSPRGEFVKTYAFADGHVDRLSSPDNNFTALEKRRGFLAQSAGD
jgi:hypothetical protein